MAKKSAAKNTKAKKQQKPISITPAMRKLHATIATKAEGWKGQDLLAEIGSSLSYLYQLTAKLKKAGLISSTPQGRETIYASRKAPQG